MTKQKRLKQRIRTRMEKTGERYAAARRHILAARPNLPDPSDSAVLHIPGNIPAVTAARILLHADPTPGNSDGRQLSEAMIFGIGGGIGAGVFAFRYEKDDFSSLYLAGRHSWHDDADYLSGLAERIGRSPRNWQTSGAKTAAKHLDEALAEGGPVIAWVDMASLPYRGMPSSWEGGGYHVLVVHAVGDENGHPVARVSDLTDEPVSIPRETLEQARGRIRKFNHRLMTFEGGGSFDLEAAVESGIRACRTSLLESRQANFRIDAFKLLAERIAGKGGKQSWDHYFPRGRHLWTALTWLYDCIEHMGTGGGLCRPIFGTFLEEAGAALSRDDLSEIGVRYSAIGEAWSALADAALSDEIDPFREAKALYAEKSELFLSEGTGATPEYRRIWARLSELGAQAGDEFPLSETEVRELRESLATRLMDVYEQEKAALEALGSGRSSS